MTIYDWDKRKNYKLEKKSNLKKLPNSEIEGVVRL